HWVRAIRWYCRRFFRRYRTRRWDPRIEAGDEIGKGLTCINAAPLRACASRINAAPLRACASRLIVEQEVTDRFDLTRDAAVEMRLPGIDDEVSSLQRGVLFDLDRWICRRNRCTNSREILPADPQRDGLVTRYALERDSRDGGNNIRIHGEL